MTHTTTTTGDKAMKTLIETAKAEAIEKWHGYDEANLIKAIEDGLVEGDRICVGPDCYCEIHGDEAVMIQDKEVMGRPKLSSLSDEQIERITIRKAVDAAKVSHSIGGAQ